MKLCQQISEFRVFSKIIQISVAFRRRYGYTNFFILYEYNHQPSETALRMSVMEKRGRGSLKEITVRVHDNDLEKAMRILKKKIQNDGLFKRLKLKKNYEKPSEYRRRKQREAVRRQRIAASRRKKFR